MHLHYDNGRIIGVYKPTNVWYSLIRCQDHVRHNKIYIEKQKIKNKYMNILTTIDVQHKRTQKFTKQIKKFAYRYSPKTLSSLQILSTLNTILDQSEWCMCHFLVCTLPAPFILLGDLALRRANAGPNTISTNLLRQSISTELGTTTSSSTSDESEEMSGIYALFNTLIRTLIGRAGSPPRVNSTCVYSKQN